MGFKLLGYDSDSVSTPVSYAYLVDGQVRYYNILKKEDDPEFKDNRVVYLGIRNLPKRRKPHNISKLRQKIFDRDGGICQLCQKPVRINQSSIDHKKPMSKGGTWGMYNLQIAHTWCNNIKCSSEEELSPEFYLTHPRYGKKHI